MHVPCGYAVGMFVEAGAVSPFNNEIVSVLRAVRETIGRILQFFPKDVVTCVVLLNASMSAVRRGAVVSRNAVAGTWLVGSVVHIDLVVPQC